MEYGRNMIYAYQCRSGHLCDPIERDFKMGDAPPSVACACGSQAKRDYGTTRLNRNDPYRDYWLSSKADHEMARQGRPLDPLAPKDMFEKRRIEAATDRRYIGDDTESLTTKGQKAVAKWKDKAKQREIAV